MNCLRKVFVAVTLLVPALLGTNASMAQPPGTDPAMVERVEHALPTEPVVQPAQPRRLLIFTLCKGYGHEVIPFSTWVLSRLGDTTGAYDAVTTDDPAMFGKDNLAAFDAVLFNNTTGTLFDDPALRQNLVAFVRNGGGLVGIHAATDCFYDWPEFGEMMGGYFNGHPWGADVTVGIRIDDPMHPVARPFDGRPFRITDEIYQFRSPYSRDRLRVLMSLDPSMTDMTREGMSRDDGDYAISWIQAYGDGRTFYCALGHNYEVFWHPRVLAHYLAGIQYALGDLRADAAPSATLPDEYIKQSENFGESRVLPGLIEDIARFEYGDNPEPLEYMRAEVIASQGDRQRREVLTKALSGLLAPEGVTPAGVMFGCRQLMLVGTPASVPALARLLAEPSFSDMARYALECMPSDDAGRALFNALEQAPVECRVGIINSLGQRGEGSAIPVLADCLLDTDSRVVAAAADALGAIGSRNSVRVLVNALGKSRDGQLICVQQALLEAMDKAGLTERKARRLYRDLWQQGGTPSVRAAALRGLALTGASETGATLVTCLQTKDPRLHNAAAAVLRDSADESAIREVLDRFNGLPLPSRKLVLLALSERRSALALGTFRELALRDGDPLQVVAIEGLANLKDLESIPRLVRLIQEADEADTHAARDALASMPGREVNATVASHISGASPELQAALLRVLRDRLAVEYAPVALDAASSPSPKVRRAAFEALAKLAGPEHRDAIISLLIGESDPRTRLAAKIAVLAVSDVEDVDTLLGVYRQASGNTPARVALMDIFLRLRADAAVPTISDSLTASAREEQEEMIEVFSRWQSAVPAEYLLSAAADYDDDRLRRRALRAALMLLGRDDSMEPDRKVRLYGRATDVADTDDERRVILSGLAVIGEEAATHLIRGFETYGELRQDVREALELAAAARVRDQGLVPVFSMLQGIEVDGDLGEWRRFSTSFGSDEKNIRASFRVEWTEDFLCVAVETHDRFVVTGGEPVAMWLRDSIQIGIDPLDENPEGYNSNIIEFGVEGDPVAPVVHAWHLADGTSRALVTHIQAAVTRNDQMTVYEVAVPWSVLRPLELTPQTRFGFNVAINDVDEDGERRGTQWVPGMLQGKDAASFGTLVLIESGATDAEPRIKK